MRSQPILMTPRLQLRPFRAADAAEVQRLAGDVRIADTTTAIPHPYPDGVAETWIAGHAQALADNTEVNFAITLRSSGALIGAVSLLDISARHARAELGYWLAVDHWNAGYCSEAARAVVKHVLAFGDITRVVARCLARNPASARVMEKAGLQREGLLPKHVLRNGRFEDMLLYGTVLPGRQDGDRAGYDLSGAPQRHERKPTESQ